ncbi:condensation domain-containing protein [Kibdelosporangium persicum]|uniref:Siderophore biosynthesis non-ribosomal peptide synthetase module n=1 Tax=Kibdelosporangium persicum TaxID=2698649 RepID=A0ABX2FDI8_9PSEU|nr:condensation domain-containing protein [Kibdelosporangium persicum]NRN69424.1 siderophore biosynthesis non-ribosomal peptide synthetase module [Kibdelosporangium persicum]
MTVDSPASIVPTQEMQWELMYALSPSDPGASRVLIVDNRYLDGPLDRKAMTAAFDDVIARQDALRLTFTTVAPDPAVVVNDRIDPPVEFLDLSGWTETAQSDRVQELAYQENRRRFDLGGPLWHAWVVRLSEVTCLVNVSFSHVIADGAACDVFMHDLLTAYQARTGDGPGWTSDAPSFAEIHTIQSRRFEARADRVAHWRANLAPVPQNPVFTRSAPPDADLLGRARVGFELPTPTATELRRIAWRASTTPFVVVLTAYHVLLSLLGHKERTVIASGTLARPTKAERRSVMQFVTDTYVCVDTPDGAALRDVVGNAHRSMSEGVENLLSYKTIARAVNPRFDSARPWADYHLCDGHFYSGASYRPASEDSRLRLRHAYIPGRPPAEQSSDLVAGALPADLFEAWDAWCGPSVAMGNPRNGGVLLYNDQVYPTEVMRGLVDTYLWIVEALAWSPQTKVGDLREEYERDRRLGT